MACIYKGSKVNEFYLIVLCMMLVGIGYVVSILRDILFELRILANSVIKRRHE